MNLRETARCVVLNVRMLQASLGLRGLQTATGIRPCATSVQTGSENQPAFYLKGTGGSALVDKTAAA